MIIKKLGLFVLWCICIILGLKALTQAFSETVGIVIIVCVVVVADIVQRYLNRHERWFRKRVNMLRTICPNSPNDFRMIGVMMPGKSTMLRVMSSGIFPVTSLSKRVLTSPS